MSSAPFDIEVDVAVVGAGVVGLATARALAQSGAAPLVFERLAGPGREVTSRNSEVIHAGIYYPPGSLKAELCLRGLALLYPLCERLAVPHRRCGKLVVAVDADELDALAELQQRAELAGASGLTRVDSRWLGEHAPWLRGVAALRSERSGIVDAHALVKALEAEARAAGAEVLYRRELSAVEPHPAGGYVVTVSEPDGERVRVRCERLVNAAGLAADRVSRLAGVDGYTHHPCRGDYVRIGGRPPPIDTLIYPLPRPRLVGLGVHLTIDTAGGLRLGPDTRYVTPSDGGTSTEQAQRWGGDVDEAQCARFAEAAGRYLPWVRVEQLRPDTFGVRAKLSGPGDAWRDFVVTDEAASGHPALINLVGIESPGLTAALAIGERVQQIVSAG